MRRISIALALFISLLVSVSLAQQTATISQQTATSAGNPANTTKLSGGPDTVINCVGAQVGRIAIFTQTLPPNVILCNSGIYEAPPYGTGAIGILNPHPVAALDVTGATNTSLYYQIGGSSVLRLGSPADQNLFIGVAAGLNNVAGFGQNTYVGYAAGVHNDRGTQNAFFGTGAGGLNAASSNTFLGAYAGGNSVQGSNSTFVGGGAGYVSAGQDNTFVGVLAGNNNTTGSENTYIGGSAGVANSSGSYNMFIGTGAGDFNTTGGSDVYIVSSGCTYPCSENNTIRIGTQGTGNGQQNVAYIAGIYGSTSSSGIPVYINSNGQLGTMTSSRRFKEQVRDMGDSTNALMTLRPVTFLYKPEYDKGERTLQYGLIAEEVAKVYPELVSYDRDGQPYTVRYQYLTTMLLNEVQKEYHRAEAQTELIKAQQQEIESLQQQLQVQNAMVQERLLRLEALARVDIAAAK
jgi:hypothetical protein